MLMHPFGTPHTSDSKNSRIGRGMDRLSRHYDLLAQLLSFGKVRAYQKRAISLINQADRIAIIGGGSGEIIKDVLSVFPNSKIHFIELSGSMLEQAKKRGLQNVQFTHGSEKELYGSYDLIILPFILNCLDREEIKDFIRKISPSLSTTGRLLIIDFDPSTGSIFQSLYLKLLYLGFRTFVPIRARKLNNYLKILQEQGFREVKNISDSRSWYRGSLQTQHK